MSLLSAPLKFHFYDTIQSRLLYLLLLYFLTVITSKVNCSHLNNSLWSISLSVSLSLCLFSLLLFQQVSEMHSRYPVEPLV